MAIRIIIILSSLTLVSLQQTTINNNNEGRPNPTMASHNVNDYENAIVVDAGQTKIVTTSFSNLFSDDKPCECVPYYLCTTQNTVVTDGAGIIDIRMKNTCTNLMEVCCNPPNILNQASTTMPTKYPNRNDGSDGSRSRGCGRRNNEGAGVRIKGDLNNEAEFGEFPWMIAVIRVERVNDDTYLNMYQCGGSLIHPRVIMTAAHCVVNKDVKTLQVRAGEWDSQSENERFPHETQTITQIIVHEQYYSGGLFNDIALLVTERPFNLTDHINTVCIPLQNTIQNEGTTCTATGWGKDEFGKNGTYQVILKKIDLPIVRRDECEKQLRTTRLGQFFKLHKSFICAGGEAGRDTCKGDGGGPLVCPVTETKLPGSYEIRYQQAGIIAWGISCGEGNIPGVYVNVAGLRDWIDNKMRQLNFDTSYYTLQ